MNIYHAGLLAMRRALEALPIRPQHVLVDARSIPDVDTPQNCFNKGDGIDFSIAAASIVAKTHRDRLMDELAIAVPALRLRAAQGLQHAGAPGRNPHPRPVRDPPPSFTFIRELCGEYSTLFYDLKGRLDVAAARAELQALDDELAACAGALAEHEQRKLKLVLSRRWKAL